MDYLRYKPNAFWMLDDSTPFQDYSGYGRSGTLAGSQDKALSLAAQATFAQAFDNTLKATFDCPVYRAGSEEKPFSIGATVYPVFRTSGNIKQTEYTNLVTNPSAETNLTGYQSWPGVGGVSARTRPTTGGLFGSAFTRATWSTASTNSGDLGWGYINCIAGEVHSVSLWVRSSVARNMTMSMQFIDATSTISGGTASGSVALAANTWTLLKLENVIIPAGAVRYKMYAAVSSGAWAVNDTLDIDGLMAVKGATVPRYFDGSMPGYEWTGTAHASTSKTITKVSRINYALDPEATSYGSVITNVGAGTFDSVVDTTIFNSGTGSLKLTSNASNPIGAKFMIPGNTGLAAGDVVRWSLWVRSSIANSTITAYWERLTPTYTGGIASSAYTLPVNTWTQITGTLTISASQAATGNWGFGFFSNSGLYAVGQSVWMDTGLIEINTSALGTFFSGATMGSEWSGTANASASYVLASAGATQILSNLNRFDGLSIDGTKISFSTKYVNTGEAKCTYDMQVAQKVDVFGIHSPDKNSLYVNGKLVDEVDISAAQRADVYDSPDANLYAGLSNSSMGINANAYVTYPRALASEDIARLYAYNNRRAVGSVPKMFGGEDVFVGSSVRPAFLKTGWFSDDDWNSASKDLVAVEDGQLIAQMQNGLTLAGTWVDAVDLYNGETASILDAINLFWYGAGETVEASVDGITWVKVAKGENLSLITPGFNPTNKALYVRVTFAAGLSEAYIDSLEVKGYLPGTVYSNNRILTYANPAVVFDEQEPGALREDWGVRINGGSLTVGPDTISEVPSPVLTVEVWTKKMTEANVSFSTNLSGAATTKYSNGLAGAGYDTGEWTVRHFVNAAGITGNLTFTGYGNIGKVAIYPTALTAAQITQIVDNYTGVTKISQDGTGVIGVTEPASSVSVYAYDWEVLNA